MFTFSERNRLRCESPTGFNHPINSWSLSDWMTALTGEVGEAANVIKKLNRIRDGVQNRETEAELRQMLADELADAACYLDLLAQAAGYDLNTIRDAKFAEVSDRIGYVECNAPPIDYEQPLQCEVIGGRLVISMGIAVNAFAIETGDDMANYNEDTGKYEHPKVTNVEGFAKDVCRALCHEEEDGSSPLTHLFDEASRAAFEDGSEWINYEPA